MAVARAARLALLLPWIILGGCDPASPNPSVDEVVAQQLETVITMHGWPCGGVVSSTPLESGFFETECRDGHVYELFLRKDWNWRNPERQTQLHGMIDIGAQVALLRSPSAAVRERAATKLAQIGPQAFSAVPALIEALSDDDALVRRATAHALGSIGPAAASASSALNVLLEDPDPTVRLGAANAFSAINDH